MSAMQRSSTTTASIALAVLSIAATTVVAAAPPLISGTQLFIDDHVIDTAAGLTKALNQPVKHPRNPLIVPDLPWEEHSFYANGTVIYDHQDRLFKAWVHLWKHKGKERAS